MFDISLDHVAICHHQSILSEELSVIYQIKDLLESLQNKSAQNADVLLNTHYILEQKDYANSHEYWIRSRMAILESISEKCVHLSDSVSDLIDKSNF